MFQWARIRKFHGLLEAVYDLANEESVKAKFGKKAQLTRGQCAFFFRILTQDHPSLADRKQVLNVAVRHTPAEVTLAVMFEFEHNSKLRRHRDIST